MLQLPNKFFVDWGSLTTISRPCSKSLREVLGPRASPASPLRVKSETCKESFFSARGTGAAKPRPAEMAETARVAAGGPSCRANTFHELRRRREQTSSRHRPAGPTRAVAKQTGESTTIPPLHLRGAWDSARRTSSTPNSVTRCSSGCRAPQVGYFFPPSRS